MTYANYRFSAYVEVRHQLLKSVLLAKSINTGKGTLDRAFHNGTVSFSFILYACTFEHLAYLGLNLYNKCFKINNTLIYS